jgi:hypothetical protein
MLEMAPLPVPLSRAALVDVTNNAAHGKLGQLPAPIPAPASKSRTKPATENSPPRPLREHTSDSIAKLKHKQLKALCAEYPKNLRSTGSEKQLIEECQAAAKLLQASSPLPELGIVRRPSTVHSVGSTKQKKQECLRHVWSEVWGRCMICGVEKEPGIKPPLQADSRLSGRFYGVPDSAVQSERPALAVGKSSAVGTASSKEKQVVGPREATAAESAKGPQLKGSLKLIGYTIGKAVPLAKKALIQYGEKLRAQVLNACCPK